MNKCEFRWLEREDGSKDLQYRIYQYTVMCATYVDPTSPNTLLSKGYYNSYTWSEWITIPTVKE